MGVAMLELQLLALEFAAAFEMEVKSEMPPPAPAPRVTIVPPEIRIALKLANHPPDQNSHPRRSKVTETSAPSPAKLNVLQLLELVKNIISDMSPLVSVKMGKLMLELVQAVEEDEPLLRDRVETILLENDSADAEFAPARKERGAEQACVGTI